MTMRIAIVNDTQMATECLKRVVLSVPAYEIAWIAQNGREAVEQCAADIPDLILMDLIMPVMDGVEATRRIMQHSPCMILVVTSSITGNSRQVFEAMGAGARDAVNTPILAGDNNEGTQDFLQKLEIMRRLINPKISQKPRRSQRPKESSGQSKTETKQTKSNKLLIAIAASTGGPNALATVLGRFPLDFPAAFLIAQHVDQQFVQEFANWLNDQVVLPVQLAKAGDKIQSGRVLVADSRRHLQVVKNQSVDYTDEPEKYPYKPSANVLFQSVADYWMGNAVGVLLTGMGKDGAAGLLEMRNKGFETIAQDQDSCAVYGMPKAAVAIQAARQILPLNKIGDTICQQFATSRNIQAAGNE